MSRASATISIPTSQLIRSLRSSHASYLHWTKFFQKVNDYFVRNGGFSSIFRSIPITTNEIELVEIRSFSDLATDETRIREGRTDLSQRREEIETPLRLRAFARNPTPPVVASLLTEPHHRNSPRKTTKCAIEERRGQISRKGAKARRNRNTFATSRLCAKPHTPCCGRSPDRATPQEFTTKDHKVRNRREGRTDLSQRREEIETPLRLRAFARNPF